MNVVRPFFPRNNQTNTIAATSSSTATKVLDNAASTSNWAARFYNAGTVPVFVASGSSGITTTAATGLPIAPGGVEVLTMEGAYIATITASGTATLYVTEGSGL